MKITKKELRNLIINEVKKVILVESPSFNFIKKLKKSRPNLQSNIKKFLDELIKDDIDSSKAKSIISKHISNYKSMPSSTINSIFNDYNAIRKLIKKDIRMLKSIDDPSRKNNNLIRNLNFLLKMFSELSKKNPDKKAVMFYVASAFELYDYKINWSGKGGHFSGAGASDVF